MTTRRFFTGLALALLAAACQSSATGSQPTTAPTTTSAASNAPATAPPERPSPTPRRPALKIVAATSWAASFAQAAGATNVATIAPANVQHPPDYDPKPSDLAAIAGADYILLGGFEGFAQRMKDAVGGSANKLITVKLENTPETIRAEVTRLGELFGTGEAAKAWLATFDAEYARLSDDVKTKLGSNRPAVVAHAFMAPWAAFAGLPVVGTYGPAPLTPGQLADLVAKQPGAVFENAHVPGGQAIVEATGAKKVDLINFPNANQSLLDVFAFNARLITAALGT